MQFNPDNSIKIAISDVQLGMFVTAIEQSERVNLANAGRVSSQAGISQLHKSGVKFVWVDESLSSKKCTFKPVPVEVKVEEPQPVARKPLGDRSIRNKKAKQLITEARGLAQKILNETFNGKPIDLGPIDDWADDVIDTILVDPDAIKCVSALRSKDTYLLEHSVNVACLLVTFGKFLEFDKDTLKHLAVGGILHDIGKIKVDDKVLNKPGKLTADEFEHMKKHQVFAEEIIPTVQGLNEISKNVCLMHHEKLDGNGYPNGLKGEEIPIYGRMSCIVDIYDALTAQRCYKEGMSSAEAFKILLSLTPFHLDQELVYKFINCIGVYPVGSIVELSDGKVGIVWTTNEQQALKPEVKVFYSRRYKRFTDVSFIDLKRSELKITKAIAPSNLEVDATAFFDS
ncbi:HD-GYP domain-containing protein [Vibrio sp. SCSIO 43136]|uniref:HD-GYP domain-containing protein n=1 Tax=Vibrio sp. SCSIO 43136 TaxID=2819101 RepID=UPI002074B19C|nr:HD-GYP domain-containing protein [Vibrio sp. SCSIO 43136]USD66817.1 HD-GYP domain-containing protein [Vibrio sp. SCSIO 43136]